MSLSHYRSVLHWSDNFDGSLEDAYQKYKNTSVSYCTRFIGLTDARWELWKHLYDSFLLFLQLMGHDSSQSDYDQIHDDFLSTLRVSDFNLCSEWFLQEASRAYVWWESMNLLSVLMKNKSLVVSHEKSVAISSVLLLLEWVS